MADSAEAWERQPGESAAAWEAFACYRDLGLSRSIGKVAERLAKSRTLIERWVLRAEAWDREQDRLWRAERHQAAREVARRHARLASAAQSKIVAQLQQLDPARLSPSDVIRWLEVTIRIERQAYGMDLADTAASTSKGPGDGRRVGPDGRGTPSPYGAAAPRTGRPHRNTR